MAFSYLKRPDYAQNAIDTLNMGIKRFSENEEIKLLHDELYCVLGIKENA